jgi:hypothetical protein
LGICGTDRHLSLGDFLSVKILDEDSTNEEDDSTLHCGGFFVADPWMWDRFGTHELPPTTANG